MIFAIEIVGAEFVGEIVPVPIFQHQAAEHGLLGLERIRRRIRLLLEFERSAHRHSIMQRIATSGLVCNGGSRRKRIGPDQAGRFGYTRSEERRVWGEGGSTRDTRWVSDLNKKKN